MGKEGEKSQFPWQSCERGMGRDGIFPISLSASHTQGVVVLALTPRPCSQQVRTVGT